jgi:hypothetical protein
MEKVTVEAIAKDVASEIIAKDRPPYDDESLASMAGRMVAAFWPRIEQLNQAIVTRQKGQEAADGKARIADENSVRLTARNTALEATYLNVRREIDSVDAVKVAKA